MNYRRVWTEGGTYFFTVVTNDRRKIFGHVENVKLLKGVFEKVKMEHPFEIDAFVLLPDHFHCVWTLPKNDDDFSMRMRLIKSYFSRECDKRYETETSYSRIEKKERNIWQRRFWEHWIKDERDYESHVNYIHFNPVKHGYAKAPREWKYSSFHRYVEKGMHNIDWGANEEIKFDTKVGNE